MRLLLWLVALLLVAGLAAVLYLLFRPRPLPAGAVSGELGNIVSLALNVALFFIAIFSLLVAMAAYQSAEVSGSKQQETLDASRKALEATVDIARQQQTALESVVGLSQKQHAALDQSLKLAE